MADFKIGEIEYTINADGFVTAEKTNYTTVHGIVIPEMIEYENKKYKVTAIGELNHCIGISIPLSVTMIGKLTGCESVNIPSSVTSIGALQSCENITIPATVTSLGDVYNCRVMKIEFPKGITAIGAISGLNGITIPSSVSTIKELDYCCGITIPSSVTLIGELVVCDNITIPPSVTSIKGLRCCKNIIIPSSVNSIRYISNCQGITLSSSITSIGSLTCFSYDKKGSLILTVPSSVLSISEIDGENGSMLLRMESSNPPSVGKVINMSREDLLVVPQGALEVYKNDPMWGKFKTIREDPSLGKGVASTQQQTPATNNGATEKENAELKRLIVKKDEEIAELKKQLAKKDEEIAELKRQLEAKKASEPSKPQPAPVRPVATAQPSAPTAPSVKGVFKLEEYKSKGKLCHTIVKTYVEQHPDVTLAQLKQVFNVPKCDVIVESLEKAMAMTDSSGKAGGCHYVKEADQIKIKEGIVVVWNYWPERYYPDFIANAKKAGFTIE